MDTSKIRLRFTDGRELDFEAFFALPADRVALEQRFNISTNTLGTTEAREEWVLFLVWLAASRCLDDEAGSSFEGFIEGLLKYEFVGGIASSNPTGEALTG